MRKILCSIAFLFCLFSMNSICKFERLYYCTAADARFFNHLLNLIGSIHAVDFMDIEEIAVYDLGLKPEQIKQLSKIEKVKIYQLERRNSDILTLFPFHTNKLVAGWYAWKPVAIKQALDRFPYVLWLDAGTTVLRSLKPVFSYIRDVGYFLCTWGDPMSNGKLTWPLNKTVTQFVRKKFDLDAPDKRWVLDQEIVMCGFIGMSRSSEAYTDLLIPLYDMAQDIRYYEDDGSTPGGFGTGRNDQTLMTILARFGNFRVHRQDPFQNKFIDVSLTKSMNPFYITYLSHVVDENTHIFNSRNKLDKLNYYLGKIHYKEV